MDFKAIMYSAFADELEKISNAGAFIGGAMGWAASPNSIKGKLIGTTAGAALGQGVGGALGMAHRTFVEEPEEQRRQQLYGYVPYATTMPQQGSNFY